MDTQVTTTEGAPVTAAGTETTTTAPAKRKATKKATAAVIARRKVLAGKHKQTGAPKLDVIGLTKNPRRGAFTLMDIFQANGETISLLTIKKRKNDLIKAGKLVLDAEAAKRQHEGHGRPPQYFNFDLSKGEAKKPRTRKAKTTGEAPVVAAEPQNEAPAPAVEPAPVAEAPAPAPAEQAAPAVA